MIVTLNSLGTKDEVEEIGQSIADVFPGHTVVYTPSGIEDYVASVKGYRTNSLRSTNLILTISHQVWLRNGDEAHWRIRDLHLQRKGGSTWGDDFGRESLTYQGPVDPEKILLQADYDASRLKVMQKEVGGQYAGRTTQDPHTLVVGFRPNTTPRSNAQSTFLVGGLPEEWWMGVGYIDIPSGTNAKRFDGAIDWLDSTNIVSIGEAGHKALDERGIAHGAMPAIKDFRRADHDNIKTAQTFGMMLRETARTGEDNRSWRP